MDQTETKSSDTSCFDCISRKCRRNRASKLKTQGQGEVNSDSDITTINEPIKMNNPAKTEKQPELQLSKRNFFRCRKSISKQRWKSAFHKTKVTPRGSVSQIVPLTSSQENTLTQDRPINSILKSRQQRIETVVDWAFIVRKYREIFGKKQPSVQVEAEVESDPRPVELPFEALQRRRSSITFTRPEVFNL